MTYPVQCLQESNNHFVSNNHANAVWWALQGLKNNPSADIECELHERISISAFYCSEIEFKNAGRTSCEFLANERQLSWHRRNIARQNFTWYVHSLKYLCKSTVYKQVDFVPPDDYKPMNPSISQFNNELYMIQRTVNYLIRPDGSYDMKGDSAIRTRNYLMKLDNEYNILGSAPIEMPSDFPPPKYNLVLGFEDSRLFFWNGEPWCTSTVRELSAEGYCEITLAKISTVDENSYRLTDWRVIRPNFIELQHEKNWMPLVVGSNLYFVYSCDPTRIIDLNGNLVSLTQPSIAVDSYRGGGAVMEFENGWLALVHESITMHDSKRTYLHRFVYYDKMGRLSKITPLFYIKDLGIEFSAGITKHPTRNSVVISFGVNDIESWLAEVSIDDILVMLKPAGLDKAQLDDRQVTWNLINSEINKPLDSWRTVEIFTDIAIRSGFPMHQDIQKNWDNVLSTYWTTLTCDVLDPVLDIAATVGTAYLAGLQKLGYKNLMTINTEQEADEVVNGITYLKGDCAKTPFNNEQFGFISCLSVIEHGVNVEEFLKESHRILKNNRYLFISTDYWETPMTSDQVAWNAQIKVFSKDDIRSIIETAERIGFTLVSPFKYDCDERTVNWMGNTYTFCNLLFQKK